MPHKHKRKEENKEDYNLPPTAIAKPLSTAKNQQTVFTSDDKKKKKTERNVASANTAYKFDDTPKAFSRLLQKQQGTRSGLDDGLPKKKRKRGEKEEPKAKEGSNTKKGTTVEMPKIMPGEKLRDFNARVDQVLSISGLARKGNKGLAPGEKITRTKTEKRMHKMYDEWRAEDQRRKDKIEEEQEKREEEEEERDAEFGAATTIPEFTSRKKRLRMIGEAKDDGDPWAVLNERREKPKGLHDVALAPPEFTVIPREKFKVKNGARADVADVPNSAGSLARREELGAERKNIIEQYRALMAQRSA